MIILDFNCIFDIRCTLILCDHFNARVRYLRRFPVHVNFYLISTDALENRLLVDYLRRFQYCTQGKTTQSNTLASFSMKG